MDYVQCLRPAQGQTVDDQDEKVVIPQTLGSLPSNYSLRTLYGENEYPNGAEPEMGAAKLAGGHAKYAGEPPDGGFKAWSVILA